jgi:D-alanyl-D-alanine endopeptidase (penicillin-binding protein 7)
MPIQIVTGCLAKGSQVIFPRPSKTSRLWCVLAAFVCFGLYVGPASAESRTTTQAAPKKSTAKRTTVRKSTASRTSTARSTSRSTIRRSAYRSRAAAQARALREAQEPRFKLDESGALVPDVRAEAAIIYDSATGQVLWELNSQDQRSIASITKVMTAVVFLESSPDLSEDVVVQPVDVRAASTTYLRSGYRVTKGDLLHLTLMASDNAAARALARVSSYGSEAFIERMNSKAAELGLESTSYSDPSGLLAANVSSAYDMARLISFVKGDERIAGVMRKQTYTVTSGRRVINIHSTNQLVMNGDVDVQAGKTGFISKSGYCLATLLRLPQGGPEIAVVVLGAKSNAGRFWETRHLFNWISSKAEDLLGTPLQAATATAN